MSVRCRCCETRVVIVDDMQKTKVLLTAKMIPYETFSNLMMVWRWSGLCSKDAQLQRFKALSAFVNHLRICSCILDVSAPVSLCVFFICASHRSPKAHCDAGSVPKARWDLRNMKYLTQPVLTVTYWGRASCLSMPGIDFMLRGSRDATVRCDGRTTFSWSETTRLTGVSSVLVLSQAVCELPRIPQMHEAQVNCCVQVCVCLHSDYSRVQQTGSCSSVRSDTIM